MITIEKFKAGNFITQSDYKVFVPNVINDKWIWTDPELNILLSAASRELGGLNSFSELIPDVDLYIAMHINTEANRSNLIEGTNTKIEEDLMSLEDLSPEKRKDVEEVQNYIKAMNYGIEKIKNEKFPICSRLIKELHGILLRGVRGEYKTPGEFRKSQNYIGGDKPSNAAYVPPPVYEVEGLMSDIDKFINENNNLPELLKCAILHYQFESIHPFLDGNGRVGRLIIPLYLLSKSELDKPCFYISDYFEKHRTEYYDALQNVRIKNDLLTWAKLFLRACIETAQKAKEKFRKVVALVNENNVYLFSLKGESKNSFKKVLTFLYSYPVATISKIASGTDLSIPAVTKCIKRLVQDNMAEELTGYKRNRYFALMEYINIFLS